MGGLISFTTEYLSHDFVAKLYLWSMNVQEATSLYGSGIHLLHTMHPRKPQRVKCPNTWDPTAFILQKNFLLTPAFPKLLLQFGRVLQAIS